MAPCSRQKSTDLRKFPVRLYVYEFLVVQKFGISKFHRISKNGVALPKFSDFFQHVANQIDFVLCHIVARRQINPIEGGNAFRFVPAN